MENPPFWWYLSGKMVIFMGYVRFREGIRQVNDSSCMILDWLSCQEKWINYCSRQCHRFDSDYGWVSWKFVFHTDYLRIGQGMFHALLDRVWQCSCWVWQHQLCRNCKFPPRARQEGNLQKTSDMEMIFLDPPRGDQGPYATNFGQRKTMNSMSNWCPFTSKKCWKPSQNLSRSDPYRDIIIECVRSKNHFLGCKRCIQGASVPENPGMFFMSL